MLNAVRISFAIICVTTSISIVTLFLSDFSTRLTDLAKQVISSSENLSKDESYIDQVVGDFAPIRNFDGDCAFLLVGNRISPVERELISALDFTFLPNVWIPVQAVELCVNYSFVIVQSNSSALCRLLKQGFRKVIQTPNSGYICFAKKGLCNSFLCKDPMGRASAMLLQKGIILFCVYFCCIVVVQKLGFFGCPVIKLSIYFVCAGAICFFFVLSHTLLSPNGTAVYAGRAKLIYHLWGLPNGYFTDPKWTVFQPSYPMGLTFLVLIYYLVSGSCDNWIVQMIPFLGVFLSFLLAWNVCQSVIDYIVVGAFLFSSTTLSICAGFYPEGFMIFPLCCFVAFHQAGLKCAWLIVFMTTMVLFKYEGVVFYIIAMIGISCYFNELTMRRILPIVFCLILFLSWYFFCFNIGSLPDGFVLNNLQTMAVQAKSFLAYFVYICFYNIDSGLVFIPIFLAASSFKCLSQNDGTILFCRFFIIVALLCIMVIYAFCEPIDFEWHMKSSMKRLAWTPTFIAVLGVVLLLRIMRRRS